MLNGCTALFRPLRQRSETDRVGRFGQALPILRPLQKIPGHRSRDLKSRLPLIVELNLYGTGRTLWVRLHMFSVESELLHATQRFEPKGVLTHAAGHNPLVAHQGAYVGEVRRRPSEARA